MLELIKVKYDQEVKKQLEKRFIAFDVETTGLDPQKEKIIELGAVFFENGKAIERTLREQFPLAKAERRSYRCRKKR